MCWRFFFLAGLQLVLGTGTGIPKYITLCHYNEPKLEECLQTAAEAIRPYMKHGVPELYIPVLNPLQIPRIKLENEGAFNAFFQNIRVFYTDEFQITKIKADLNQTVFEINLRFPRLRILSKYELNGRFLLFNFDGNGKNHINLTDIETSHVFKANQTTRGGKQFWSFEKHFWDFRIEKTIVRFDNLFAESQVLTEQINKAVNENIEVFYDEIKPMLKDAISNIVIRIVNKVFDRYSIDELFPK